MPWWHGVVCAFLMACTVYNVLDQMAHQAVLAIAPNVTMWRKTCYVSFSGSAITRRTQFLCQSPKGLTLSAQAKKDDDNKKDGEENWSENLGKVADSLKGS